MTTQSRYLPASVPVCDNPAVRSALWPLGLRVFHSGQQTEETRLTLGDGSLSPVRSDTWRLGPRRHPRATSAPVMYHKGEECTTCVTVMSRTKTSASSVY